MSYAASCFSNKERIGNYPRRWHRPDWNWRSLAGDETRRAVIRGFIALIILAPSLIAEIAPLFVFWHAQLPLWQLVSMMAAA
jgi:hypothetical protein